MIPSTLRQPVAWSFWLAVLLTGAGTGVAAAALTRLLELVQRLARGGAGAVLAATTQGPVSTVVLLMDLTGRDRSFILPLLLIAAVATLVARSIEPRSIYDAKLTGEQIAARQRMRDRVSQQPLPAA